MGKCDNHQLEYLDYFETQMQQILGPFGVVMHRYGFNSPGTGSRGAYLDAAGGQAYNVSATVPGADHPDESVLVSGHYDFTDSGPAAAWDSAEGHAEVMRIAKIMADYWTATGTRPAATVKFIPWDSEESGTFGSIDYVNNNIPPGEEDKVRGYFNMDPCSSAYPAFKNGNPATRTPEVLQLADPAAYTDPAVIARVQSFNTRAETIVDEVFGHLDDKLLSAVGTPDIFVSDSEGTMAVPSQRGEIVTALGGLAIFSSDYANFAAVGIPIFNLFPDYFGPHADGTPGQNDGLAILHTPNDNLTTINKLTSADPTGLMASEGWAKGMEMCAHIEGWYMLQPEMGGGQTADTTVVAYYEALPNEAIQNQNVSFDASGSYQYSVAATHTIVPDASISYAWDFGDGQVGTGKTVQHAYPEVGKYQTTLTVTGPGGTDTMTLPVTVIGSNFSPPTLETPAATDTADGNFPLSWDFTGTPSGFSHYSVKESTDYVTLFADDGDGDINARWTVTPPSQPGVQPWQSSDSGTVKFRGNQMHSGERSFWTGVSPPDFNPGPASATSALTLKAPIIVPASGEPDLSYWSLFQNEGDDQGRVEVALDDGNPATEPEWNAVDVIQATNTSAGGNDPAVCDPSSPDTLTRTLESRRVSLGAYRGKTVVVRFVYLLGAENRAASQPCGWYVDDARITSGTFTQIGTTTAKTFQVGGKAAGDYAYRIEGVYNDGVRTAASNTELARVTLGGPGFCPGSELLVGKHIVGTAKGEVLQGSASRDIMCGLGGDDHLRGLAGDDLLAGGSGDDDLAGGADPDVLHGDAGKDVLAGDAGNDLLDGDTGQDAASFPGGVGVTASLAAGIATGIGSDKLVAIEDLRGSSAADRLFGNAGPNLLVGGNGGDVLRGRRGNDRLLGGNGKDRLRGARGADTLHGGKGADRLLGGRGADRLNGGKGTDFCAGGPGQDTKVHCDPRQA